MRFHRAERQTREICDLAMRHDAARGEVYVIAGEQPVTCRELIDGFCRVLSLPEPWLKVPYRLGRALAMTSEFVFGCVHREPPFSRRTLEFFDTDNAFDISKAKYQLGYQPSFDLERGLAQTKPWLESVDNRG